MAYVTLQEFKNAPTGIDTMSIIPGGTQAQNDAELANVLERASAWANQITGQETLEATQDTDLRQVNANFRDGSIYIVPDATPIVSLVSVKCRVAGGEWETVDLANVEVYTNHFIIRRQSDALTALEYSAQARIPMQAEYTYVNGWANTTLQSAAIGGATTITPTDLTGMYDGQRLTIYDDANTEVVTVASVGASNAVLAKPLKFSHSTGAGVSALPASIKQAVILLAAYLIKERGSLSVSMNETSLQGIGRYKDAADVDIARELLAPFKKVL